MKKRRIEIAVISDVHLGSQECRAEELLAYLSSINPRKLVLNGDLIHCGKAVRKDFPGTHFKVLKKVLGMAASGTEVFYIRGDHEAGLKSFRTFELGNFQMRNQLQLTLDGKKAWFFHGDAFDPMPWAGRWFARFGREGYDFLRTANRGIRRMRILLGKLPVSMSARLNGSPAKTDENTSCFENTTSTWAIRNGYEMVICGHLHRAAKYWKETPAGKVLYLNSGDWVESLTALEYNFKRWKLYRYNEDKLSPFFADEDLKEMDVDELIASLTAKKGHQQPRESTNSSGE